MLISFIITIGLDHQAHVMVALRSLILMRCLSTSRASFIPALSADYKSSQLWDTRFRCQMLNDASRIKTINTKILLKSELDNIEMDIFINVASVRTDDISALREAVKILTRFRRSVLAHTLLPSTHHAACRLFLDSNQLPSLMAILEARVKFGIFPDAFVLNLIFDEALRLDQLSLASRAAALMMLQEEFGLNKISDMFALYATSKYIETKTDFNDWIIKSIDDDPIFNESLKPDEAKSKSEGRTVEVQKDEKEEEDEDEDEDDAEYHRVPFLRNPYFDNHFDLKNPRVICGKTLTMLGLHLSQIKSDELAIRCKILGGILQGYFSEAHNSLNCAVQSRITLDPSIKELCLHYIDNLHGVEAPCDHTKNCLVSSLDKLNQSADAKNLSQMAENEFNKLKDVEQNDINWLNRNLIQWSELRRRFLKTMQEIEERKRLIEEIKIKKEELRRREEFLFFYDKLKKQSLTKMDYK